MKVVGSQISWYQVHLKPWKKTIHNTYRYQQKLLYDLVFFIQVLYCPFIKGEPFTIPCQNNKENRNNNKLHVNLQILNNLSILHIFNIESFYYYYLNFCSTNSIISQILCFLFEIILKQSIVCTCCRLLKFSIN